MAIKFQKFYVTDGVTKARVSYSAGSILVKQPDGSRQLRECITLYAKDYGATLRNIPELAASNDSDHITDYVVEDVARIFPDSPLYPAAKQRCDERGAYWKDKREAADAKCAARRAAMYGQPAQVEA